MSHPIYTPGFRDESVQQVVEHGYTVKEVANRPPNGSTPGPEMGLPAGRRAHSTQLLRCVALVLLGSTGGCDLVEPEEVLRVCPEGGHWASYGCASLLATIEAPPGPWPVPHRWSVRAVAARSGAMVPLTVGENAGPGLVTLNIVRSGPVPPTPAPADTASVWVIATLFEDPRPIQVGVPLPVFAVDSVLQVIEFAKPGARPTVVTIHLRPRVVEASKDEGDLAGP